MPSGATAECRRRAPPRPAPTSLTRSRADMDLEPHRRAYRGGFGKDLMRTPRARCATGPVGRRAATPKAKGLSQPEYHPTIVC